MANHMGSDAARRRAYERMLPHIPKCDPDDEDSWISGRELDAKADVTEHQRSAGINWGRRNACADKLWSLVSGRKGYRFVSTAKQAAPFVIPRYKAIETLLEVSYLGAQRPLLNRLVAEGKVTPTVAQMIDTSIDRCVQDLRRLAGVVFD